MVVQMKFNMGTLDLDNYIASVLRQLIDHSI